MSTSCSRRSFKVCMPVARYVTPEEFKRFGVVITSVDRDDLRDGGASHFTACIEAIREKIPAIKIEILVPDYRGRMKRALIETGKALPDVFNRNIKTVPRSYKQSRP